MVRPFETLSKRGQVGRLKRLALEALGAYELPQVKLTPLVHGDNTTFRVDAGEECFVLRVQRPGRPLEGVRAEATWLTYLNTHERFAVPSPLETRDGDVLVVASVPGVPEARTCLVFRWVEGRFIDEHLTPKHLRRVGSFMARLHDSDARFVRPEGFVRGRLGQLCGKPHPVSEAEARAMVHRPDDEAKAVMLVSEAFSSAEGGEIEAFLERARSIQLELGHDPRVFGLVHGDLHQENYLWKGSEIRAIDFDDCGFGHFLYDVAVPLLELEGREDTPQLKAALLDGYQEVRSLPEGHQRYLDMFLPLRALQLLLWIYELRDHPHFRDSWREDVDETFAYIRTYL